MALVAHTIYSQYNPGLDTEEADSVPYNFEGDDDVWQRAGPSRLPPHFVPAKVISVEQQQEVPLSNPSRAGESVSTWYRSLTNTAPSTKPPLLTPKKPSQTTRSQPSSIVEQQLSKPSTPNWFSSSRPSTPSSIPGDSIADKLSRDPPQLNNASAKIFTPWLMLGPSNKGYELLSKSGWREGEGLGARVGIGYTPPQEEGQAEEAEVGEEVVDLTLTSDSEEEEFPSAPPHPVSQPLPPSSTSNQLPSGGISLLTPLPTILKSDRLGIGSKTKYTTTPSGLHIPLRRVTHGQKALLAHAQAAEEARQHRKKWGRGKRGFQRMAKKEAESRKRVLAYMNS